MWLAIPIMLGPVVAHWLSIAVAARRLPRERRRIGDTRPIPELFDPATSHRWLGIILEEKTADYSPSTRRAFGMARVSLCLIPLGFILAMAVANSGLGSRPEAPPRSGLPPVTLKIDPDRAARSLKG
ncbi:hypothetical protein [Brevundimonas sp.]|uniref:hypothetical protein n=1 Tax=Brevundimonas sp. TaxID=1871086 RepID=UPI0037BE778C